MCIRDSERVLRHLEAHGEILERVTVRAEFPLDERQSADFLRMTPMTFSIPEEERREKQVGKITIHMEVCMVKVLSLIHISQNLVLHRKTPPSPMRKRGKMFSVRPFSF